MQPPDRPQDVQVQWDVAIAARDGVCLRANLYMPVTCTEPSAVICTMTPYTAQTYHPQALHYASHGYPFLVVDVRGRGGSEGQFHPINEAQDAYDIVEWVARQPFCNGKVAMWGGSYTGYCQWTTAKEHPPHLVTIVPVASSCYGVDFPMRNNIFAPYTMQWLMFVRARTLQDKIFLDKPFWQQLYRRWFESGRPFKEFDAVCGDPSSLFQEWLAHPHRDEYWDRYSPAAADYAKLTLPILTITGAYDGDQVGALHYYRGHMKNAPPQAQAGHYLVIGPWDHAGCGTPAAEFGGLKFGSASLVDMRKLLREWYAWTLRDGPRPGFLQKNVAYYVAGSEKWRYADTLEQVTARFEPLYLHSDGNADDVFASGSLDPEPPSDSGPDQYVYDPCDVSLAALESTLDPHLMTDQQMTYAVAGRRLIYHTAPFKTSVEISGFFKLQVWLAIDQLDTDFHAAVYEIAHDGGSIRLATDWMRARYRKSLRHATLIDTREPQRFDFEHFTFISRRIAAGSRLRLVIGAPHSIHFEKNYNNGGAVTEESAADARIVTVRLFHDPSRPSALYVPHGQPDVG
jgi:uncharacterized protein